MVRQVKHTQRVEEPGFTMGALAHYETIMAQGNGYLGLRAAHEEDYVGGARGFYIAGTYNKDSQYEVAELPNLADILNMRLVLDGETFRMDQGTLACYARWLDLRQGELVRDVTWTSPLGRRYRLVFRRFVSRANLHLVAARVQVTALSGDCKMKLTTGMDGRTTNSGTQNMHEVEKRVLENRYLRYSTETTQSGVRVDLASVVTADANCTSLFQSPRRQLFQVLRLTLKKGAPVVLEKKSVAATSLDEDGRDVIDLLKQVEHTPYEALLAESAAVWQKKPSILIDSENSFDQFAVNFAQYHLEIMVPAHDSRCSIGAKGLTGEGYKAHVFWDTEIFLLPYFIYSHPQAARRLLEYRYRNLAGAQEKARDCGYDGALFPWESAFTGREETPPYADMNIKTGCREPVHSALKEHHIVADIGYAVLAYVRATGDEAFMREMGMELLAEAAKFWASRADRSQKPYVIKDVIGPDEYTEHIDNNAYTNYMAHYVVSECVRSARRYGAALDLAPLQDFVDNLYLPQPNAAGVLPQDDSLLSKPVIGLDKYRKRAGKQTILRDYTRQEVVGMQVLKQADAVMLLYLLPDLFSRQVALATWDYYEPKTIHDSSLSMAVHSIVAQRTGKYAEAYACFEKACRIDLGSPGSCDDGVHAASLGAIYLAIVFGFGGVRITEEGLSLHPHLPKPWKRLRFPLKYQNKTYMVDVRGEAYTMTPLEE